jgi:DUF4097 and DUF4098 domain-containing protein YvlB
MKNAPIVLLLAMLSFAVRAQDFSAKEPFSVKSLANESIQKVRVETTGGNISVAGVDANARIEVYVWPGNSRDRSLSKAEIQKRLDEEYDLTISVTDHKLTAIAKPKDNYRDGDRNLSISFRVFVPRQVSTDLRTSGGNISLHGLSGATQDFTTSGGNLDIGDVGGNITGRTSGGNISLSNSKDEIDLATSGGNVDAKNCHGNIKLTTSGGELTLRALQGTIRASTSGGSVEAEDIEGELSAHTSGGNVQMRGLSCSLETSTSGGNIDVTMKALGKYVKITNSSGNIDLQLPQGKGLNLKLYADRIKTTTLTNFTGQLDETHINGTLNGGGIPVTVDGGSGSIHLTLK